MKMVPVWTCRTCGRQWRRVEFTPHMLAPPHETPQCVEQCPVPGGSFLVAGEVMRQDGQPTLPTLPTLPMPTWDSPPKDAADLWVDEVITAHKDRLEALVAKRRADIVKIIDRQDEAKRMTALLGECYGNLIRSALRFLDEHEAEWKLQYPIDRAKFIGQLITFGSRGP